MSKLPKNIEAEIRADERQQCIDECSEVAQSLRTAGGHFEAWGAATVANYLNKTPPFGFIGPPMPKQDSERRVKQLESAIIEALEKGDVCLLECFVARKTG